MKIHKRLFFTLASTLPIAPLKRFAGITTLFPYQHTVSDKDLMHIKHLYPFKNVKQFEKDLDFLLRHFSPISLNDLVKTKTQNIASRRGTFLLTFDDGFRECEEIVAPVLYRKGIPAIFFINPAFIDNKELFYRCKLSLIIQKISEIKNERNLLERCFKTVQGKQPIAANELIRILKSVNKPDHYIIDGLASILSISFEEYLLNYKPFLSSDQIHRLAEMGFSIGGHSWNHPYYKNISVQEQIQQTITSSEYAKNRFAQPYSTFSFPHSDSEVLQNYFNGIKNQNFGIDMFFGTQNQKNEERNNVMHRFNMERPDLSPQELIKAILLLSGLKRIMGTANVTRNTVQ